MAFFKWLSYMSLNLNRCLVHNCKHAAYSIPSDLPPKRRSDSVGVNRHNNDKALANTSRGLKLAEVTSYFSLRWVHVTLASWACCLSSCPKPSRHLRDRRATPARQRCQGCCRRWGWRSRPALVPFGSPLEGKKSESCEK